MHVYVIGNVALDTTIAVTEWPAPGCSILGRHCTSDLGGKGANQAVIMARCGVPTRFIAAIGSGADALAHRLADEPVETCLITLPGRHSDFSIIFTMPDGENAIVTTTDAAADLGIDQILPVIAPAQAGDFVVLQGNLSEKATLATVIEARKRGLTTVFNPSPLRPWFNRLWPLIDIVFLNTGEAFDLTRCNGESACRLLHAQGVRDVVLTLGAEGALLSCNHNTINVTACRTTVIDTAGAGDTFMGVALASAILRHKRLDAIALSHAARASAITVARTGTLSAFPSCQEMAEILAQR